MSTTKKKLISSKAKKDQGALAVQVGGGHYKDLKIQPIEYAMANNLNFCQGNVVKYITRYKAKNGLEDLKKVQHYVDLLIEIEYSEQIKAEAEAKTKAEKKRLAVAKAQKTKAARKAHLHTLSHVKIKKSPKIVSAGTKPNQAFMRPLVPSKELIEVVGEGNRPRTNIMQDVWAYIKKHELQNKNNKREIICDEKMKVVMGGKSKVTMFELTKLVSNHLTETK